MKSRRQKAIIVIPNAFTLLNMFMGFAAMTYALNGNYEAAVKLVFLATFVDLLDGRMAKALKATSQFGAEMDSFSDIVTFGVAPALLLYQVYFKDWQLVGLAIAFMPVVFSAMRLARFNITEASSKTAFFKGVPTPVSAWLMVGLVAFADKAWGGYSYPGLAALVAVADSLLMVSAIPFESNVISSKKSLANTWKIIPFVLSILSVIVFGIAAIFPWAVFYVAVGVIRWLLQESTRQKLSAPVRLAGRLADRLTP